MQAERRYSFGGKNIPSSCRMYACGRLLSGGADGKPAKNKTPEKPARPLSAGHCTMQTPYGKISDYKKILFEKIRRKT